MLIMHVIVQVKDVVSYAIIKILEVTLTSSNPKCPGCEYRALKSIF